MNDDFEDVFGFQLAVVGDGFSYAELELRQGTKELSLVDGVARVDLWGAQRKVIYLDVAETQLTELPPSRTSPRLCGFRTRWWMPAASTC